MSAIDHKLYPNFYEVFWQANHLKVDDKGGTYHKCKLCPNNAKDYLASKNTTLGSAGNLAKHTRQVHSNWQQVYQDAEVSRMQATNTTLTTFFPRSVSDKAMNIFKWLDWIIMEDLPLTFVESKYARKNSNLTSISVHTFKKYATKVGYKVERKIAAFLPEHFGIIFDGM